MEDDLNKFDVLIHELRATRLALTKTQEDHESRIRALEKRHTMATAIVSAVTSVVTALIWAFASGF